MAWSNILTAFSLLAAFSSATVIKGPPVATKNNLFLVRRLGDEIKLTCPIEGKPVPYVDWRKDGDKIEEYLWPRFKPNRRNLKIRDAELSDSGVYLCRGVNGFGSEEIIINLIVIDPAEYPELADGELPELAPPALTQETVNFREDYELRFGDSITLSCSATGKPLPTITWYKDGVEILAYNKVKRNGRSDSELRLINLTGDETGIYSCTAENLAGKVKKEYRLAVRTAVVESPVFYTTPTNQTVAAGGQAVLDCRVRSTVPTTIKWLKKLDARAASSMLAIGAGTNVNNNNMGGIMGFDGAANNQIISVGDESYSIISRRHHNGGSSAAVQVSNDVYMSRLEVDNVTPADGGMYICFVTNSLGGFNYKQAYLTVIPKESPLVLALSISLASLTLFILAALVICLLRNRNSKKGSADPSSSFTAVGNESAEVRSNLISHHHHNNVNTGNNYIQKPPPTTCSSSNNGGGMINPPPSLDSLYNGISGSINNAPLPPPPTPVQWLYNNGSTLQAGGTTVSNNNSNGSSSIYTDSHSSQFGGGNNTYEVPRYVTAGGGSNNGGLYSHQQHRTSPVGQPAYVYGGYRH